MRGRTASGQRAHCECGSPLAPGGSSKTEPILKTQRRPRRAACQLRCWPCKDMTTFFLLDNVWSNARNIAVELLVSCPCNQDYSLAGQFRFSAFQIRPCLPIGDDPVALRIQALHVKADVWNLVWTQSSQVALQSCRAVPSIIIEAVRKRKCLHTNGFAEKGGQERHPEAENSGIPEDREDRRNARRQRPAALSHEQVMRCGPTVACI